MILQTESEENPKRHHGYYPWDLKVFKMTAVEITKTRVLIQGHSGYAPSGGDIVCAAVSTLAQTLITDLENLTEDKVKYDIEPGYIDIRHGHLSERGNLLIDAFFVGICGIADAYPDQVHICP